MSTTIGVLAGMGPRSTTPFIELLLNEAQSQYGAKYDIDYPHILVYSLPTPFYLDRPVDHQEMKDTVCGGLQRLEKAGVDFIAIPYNTVHAYYDELIKCVSVPVLNIVDETLKGIGNQIKKITVFATETTRQSKVYQMGLDKAGLDYVFSQDWQPLINQTIAAIKDNKNSQAAESWNQLINLVIIKEVSHTIIACTDLQPMISKTPDIQFIDSSQSLAKATIKKYLEINKS